MKGLLLFIALASLSKPSDACFGGNVNLSFIICYDYPNAAFKCLPSKNSTKEDCIKQFDPPAIYLGTTLSSECDVMPTGYVRCISKTTSTVTCRPIEAGCSENEILQPDEGFNQHRSSLSLLWWRYDTLEQCEAIQPYIRCVNEDIKACITDLEECDEGFIRIPSNQLFLSEVECNAYQHVPFIRCQKDSSTVKCIEFDRITQSNCSRHADYEQIPADVFYAHGECDTEDVYVPCYIDQQLTCETKTDCDEGGQVLIDNPTTLQQCALFAPMWKRFVKAGDGVECVPVSPDENVEITSADSDYVQISNDNNVFETRTECALSTFYKQCFSRDNNQFYCSTDIAGCLAGDEPNDEHWFLHRSDCIVPWKMDKCMVKATGTLNCRPSFAGCSDDEFEIGSTENWVQNSCEMVSPRYFYCYNSSDPGNPQCVADYHGCHAGTTILMRDDEVQVHASKAACTQANPEWTLCVTLLNSACRPKGAYPGDTRCEDNEKLFTDEYFSSLASCQAATPIFTTPSTTTLSAVN